MENILVIGNGFDIEHGIPSTYKNFLDFAKVYCEFYRYKGAIKHRFHEDIGKISDNFIDVLDAIQDGDEATQKILKEFYDLTEGNVWIDYFQECLKRRAQYGKGYHWVDIEEEISEVIKLITECRNDMEYIELQFSELSYLRNDTLCSSNNLLSDFMKRLREKKLQSNYETHINSSTIEENMKHWILFKKRLLSDYNNMIRSLEIYLDFFVDIEKIAVKEDLKNLHFSNLITFNYTHFYNKIYDSKTNVYFVHGNANYMRPLENNNMVIGIDEFTIEEPKDRDFLAYRKYYQRIVKKCDFNYQKIISENEDSYIWFFGHSMAISDGEILRTLLPSSNNEIKKAYICYHHQNSFEQQVSNLVQIFGHDKLNELVYSANPKIEFIDQKNLRRTMEKCLANERSERLIKAVGLAMGR